VSIFQAGSCNDMVLNALVEGLLVLPLVLEEVDVMRKVGDVELLSKVVVALESSVNDDSFKRSMVRVVSKVGRFTRDNYTIEFGAFSFSVKDFLTRHILLRCDSSGDLYPVTKPSTLSTAFVSTSSTTWHQRLGHSGDEVLRSLSSRQFISCNKAKSIHVCHACQLCKHVKLPFHSSNSLVKHSFDIIHSDL
nr:ribonuclease H-like domain-containing protein [Tanacetum cinerariifolium]